ncbi:hypothetical protein ACQ86B_27305 [Mycolicibacterium aichiense]
MGTAATGTAYAVVCPAGIIVAVVGLKLVGVMLPTAGVHRRHDQL